MAYFFWTVCFRVKADKPRVSCRQSQFYKCLDIGTFDWLDILASQISPICLVSSDGIFLPFLFRRRTGHLPPTQEWSQVIMCSFKRIHAGILYSRSSCLIGDDSHEYHISTLMLLLVIILRMVGG